MQGSLFWEHPMVSRHVSWRNKIGLGLVLWLASELAVFSFVVGEIGLGAAIILGLLTSMAGGSLLKRAGLSALNRLREEAGRDGPVILQGGMVRDETLAAIAAVLLLIPGFITDALGLVLALAAPRVWISGWLQSRMAPASAPETGTAPPRHGPAVIDLEPGDYRDIGGEGRRER